MTTLEQKAREILSGERDIALFMRGCAEALRWRDVNVELPETKPPYYKDECWLKTDTINAKGEPLTFYGVGFYMPLQKLWITENEMCIRPTHWRPIETI